jgi:hypothetical protein
LVVGTELRSSRIALCVWVRCSVMTFMKVLPAYALILKPLA